MSNNTNVNKMLAKALSITKMNMCHNILVANVFQCELQYQSYIIVLIPLI